MSPTQPAQLALPMYGGARTRTIKTTIGGTITEPFEQPARALQPYEDVIGVFRGGVTHAGGDATYVDEGGEAVQAPTHSQKIGVTSALIPLSEETQRDLHALILRILEENATAARRLGVVVENSEAKAS